MKWCAYKGLGTVTRKPLPRARTCMASTTEPPDVAAVPYHVVARAKATVDERLRLQAALRFSSSTSTNTRCLAWTAGNRVHFRGKYWLPHRLLYVLFGPENAEDAMQGKCLTSVCGTPKCVAPEHQVLADYAPPAKRRQKRKRSVESDAAAREEQRTTALLRERMLKLQATLSLIDAANGDPDAELAALQESTGLTSDLVLLPDDPDERAALLALADDPFALFRRHFGME